MVTPTSLAGCWCGSSLCKGKDFSRTRSREQDIHCFSGEVSLEIETDRKTETLFFFSYFCLSPIYVLDCSLPVLVFELVEDVCVPATAWPCCHLAKSHTFRSFHLSF